MALTFHFVSTSVRCTHPPHSTQPASSSLRSKGAAMLKRLLSINVATFTLATIFVSASIKATASHTGFTTLNVNGETVKIYRDDFGIPHVFADTNRGLFEAYGYTVAHDRLWQLELKRRAARGRLDEVLCATPCYTYHA